MSAFGKKGTKTEQGASIDEARNNLREALELFFDTASPQEIKSRLHGEIYITQVEVAVG